MEKQLFVWEDVDIIDEGAYVFINCTLIKNIGKFKEGESFDAINLNFQTGELELLRADKIEEDKLVVVGKFELLLTVVEN